MASDYDNRFDGKKVYEYLKASQAVFRISGNKLTRSMYAEPPTYEIRDDRIFKCGSASQAVFDIRNGNKIHDHLMSSQASWDPLTRRKKSYAKPPRVVAEV
jgi:hypothetical protein